MSHFSTPHYLSGVIKRSPKKTLPSLQFYTHQREFVWFTPYQFKEILMNFNIAHQVNKIKKISVFSKGEKKLFNSGIVFHDILFLHETAALGEHMKVQNSVHHQTPPPPPPPHPPYLHLPLFLYNKIKFLYNIYKGYKRFHRKNSAKEGKNSVLKQLISETATVNVSLLKIFQQIFQTNLGGV